MNATIKRLLLPQGRELRRIKAGIARGCLMHIDFHVQFQRYIGLDERELMAGMRQLISRARTLVDVGANDGLYTMAFLASKAERVVACEPGPVNEQLLANASANGYQLSDRFRLERRLVGDNVGEARLDEVLGRLPRPILVKVDVDGGEDHVLNSSNAYEHLDEVSWVVETHSAELEDACLRWFTNRGYQARITYPAWWRRFIPEQRPLEHNRWLVALPS